MNRIQFQLNYRDSCFSKKFHTEVQCEAELKQA